jgi:hypothetical protein
MLKIAAIGTDKRHKYAASATARELKAEKTSTKETRIMQLHDPTSFSAGGKAMAPGPVAAMKITRLHHADNDSQSPLLAQFPDLTEDDPEALIEEHTTSSGRQIISQALASKLVLGGGVLLVLAAILPFMFVNRVDPKPSGEELTTWHPAVPAPDADTAPAWNGPASMNAAASAGIPTVPPSVVVTAVPAGPGGSNVAPPSLIGGATDPLASRAAAAWGNNPSLPTLPAKMPPLDATSPFNRAGDGRGVPPTVRINQPMALGDRPTAPAAPTAYGSTTTANYGRLDEADSRADYRRDYRSNYPPAGIPAVNPLMPDPNRGPSPQGPRANQPPPAPQGQPPQAGVAEFQGGITATPPNRN